MPTGGMSTAVEGALCRESKMNENDMMDFDFEGEGECMILCGDGGSPEDREFDYLVSLIEEILISPEFIELQNNFCRRNCGIFEDVDENKLEYTKIFDQYTHMIEGFLETQIRRKVPEFQLDRFAHMCSRRKNEITGDVFDMLLSCGDFEEFKFLMLSYKSELNGQNQYLGLCIN